MSNLDVKVSKLDVKVSNLEVKVSVHNLFKDKSIIDLISKEKNMCLKSHLQSV